MIVNHMLLSIVIPVYKVEKYIRKCLASICDQDIDANAVEVVVVNDGTPDNSMDIVGQFKEQYPYIKVISQENAGLSCARNAGLSKATGDYVWFVDSDDWLEPSSIEQILQVIRGGKKYDVIVTLLQTVSESNGEVRKWTYPKYLKGAIETTGWDYYINEGRLGPTQQFIYRRLFLIENQLVYRPHVLHEDGEFNERAIYLAKEVYLMQDNTYNYLQRAGGSIMSSIKMQNMYDQWSNYKSVLEFAEKYVKKEHRRYYDARLAFWLAHFYFWSGSISEQQDYKDFMKEIRPFICRNIYKMLLAKHVTKVYLKNYIMVRFFPSLYTRIIRNRYLKTVRR